MSVHEGMTDVQVDLTQSHIERSCQKLSRSDFALGFNRSQTHTDIRTHYLPCASSVSTLRALSIPSPSLLQLEPLIRTQHAFKPGSFDKWLVIFVSHMHTQSLSWSTEKERQQAEASLRSGSGSISLPLLFYLGRRAWCTITYTPRRF